MSKKTKPETDIHVNQNLALLANRSAHVLAPVMFAASIGFLTGIAVLIVFFVDVPRVESMGTEDSASSFVAAGWIAKSMLVLWFLFGLELAYKIIVGRLSGVTPRWSEYIAAMCPPLRLAVPNAQMNGRIWLPRYGWRLPGKRLSRVLERKFSSPMLAIAMLILPVLLIEFKFQSQVESMPWLQSVLHICTGLIWFAFTVEFIVMVSATDKRLNYVKKNWIDLAIILLPLISFLRSMRIFRAVRVAKFAKVQQLTKMTRVYRMRGLFAKTLRALLLFEIAHRIFKISPEKRLSKLEEQLADKEEELQELRSRIEAVRMEVSRKQAEAEADLDVDVDCDSDLESQEPLDQSWIRRPRFLRKKDPKRCA